MMMNQDDLNAETWERNHLEQVLTARRRAEETARSAVRPAIADPSLIDRECARIAEENHHNALREAEWIMNTIRDDRFEPRIAMKVARAMVQRRIPESDVRNLMCAMQNLGIINRGAYAVSGFKRIFVRANLSWFEEEWE